MKKTIFILLVAAFILSSMFILTSFQTKEVGNEQSNFVVMKICDPIGNSSGITISYGDGKIEKLDLKPFGRGDHLAQNAETINNCLNKLKNEGFKLKAATGGDYINTLIFEKE